MGGHGASPGAIPARIPTTGSGQRGRFHRRAPRVLNRFSLQDGLTLRPVPQRPCGFLGIIDYNMVGYTDWPGIRPCTSPRATARLSSQQRWHPSTNEWLHRGRERALPLAGQPYCSALAGLLFPLTRTLTLGMCPNVCLAKVSLRSRRAAIGQLQTSIASARGPIRVIGRKS